MRVARTGGTLGTLLAALVDVSDRLRKTRSRRDKISALSALLHDLTDEELPIAVTWLSGEIPQGKLGIGPSLLRQVSDERPADAPALTVLDVHERLGRFKDISGAGSGAVRERAMRELLGACTRGEQDLLIRLLVGELRQGANALLVAEAAAMAAGIPAPRFRRAWMMSGDLAQTAVLARQGEDALAALKLELFRPVGPMLAEVATDPETALKVIDPAMTPAFFDVKLDGARVQVHRRGSEVRIWSRGQLEVTASIPEVVEAALALPCDEVVLDGEAIALRPDGSPLPFQVTMRRFGRKADVDEQRVKIPLTPVFFDVLWLDGRALLDEPLSARHDALQALVRPENFVERIRTGDPEEADAFYDAVVARGHEGLMVKDPTALYEAGNRGDRWLKLKPAHTLDLVVIGVERGNGRREGTLSNLHLGARQEDGGFAMVGKTFKGLTDALLAWQTAELGARAVSDDGYTVMVRPELVVEIAFSDVLESPRYPAGVALRFARVKRYREDKRAEEADTIETVKKLMHGPGNRPGKGKKEEEKE